MLFFSYSLLLFLLGTSSSVVGAPIDGRGGSQDISARSDVQVPHKQFEPNPTALSKATLLSEALYGRHDGDVMTYILFLPNRNGDSIQSVIHNRLSKSSGKWESQEKTTYRVDPLERAAEAAIKGVWKFAKEESKAHEGYEYSVNPPREIEIFTEGNKFLVRGLKV